ncbi:endolytic transglycosylase MltG [Rhodobacteraceae bacterium DSL-40]|uniref:endolytic transglycosylase MltG n=1 Tax=Amaricoccus sp. B4 TaxID=3368557 RepID=UPI000DAE3173
MMRHVAANALTLIAVALVLVFGLITWAQSQYRRPGPLTEPMRFEVEQGDTLTRVTDRLEQDGIIAHPTIFRIAARYTKQDRGLKYGEYEFEPRTSMEEVLALLNAGGNVIRQIVVPEGWTSWQVVEMLRAREELSGEITTIPTEGSLAPAGYDFQKGDSRQGIIERMQTRQSEILSQAWAGRDEGLPLKTPEELLTLASIVEKETGVAAERDLVASVFINRLERGMRLQTDPTVIYGITKGQGALGRGLRRSELVARTEFNTYVILGLPPTPIANPGRDAIMATAHPAQTDNLYFVADGTGGHVFSRTLAEHNANVVKWRQIEAERARAAEEAGTGGQ